MICLEQVRCYGCMQLKSQRPVCEHCGYDERTPGQPYVPPPRQSPKICPSP